jgi:hypothetical protein
MKTTREWKQPICNESIVHHKEKERERVKNRVKPLTAIPTLYNEIKVSIGSVISSMV